jgi:hypothetical protein
MGVKGAEPYAYWLSVITTALGTLLGLIGVLAGLLWLFNIWGIQLPWNSQIFRTHPDNMVFGFLALFVSGVAYILFPRFRNRPLGPVWVGYLATALIFVGNVLTILAATTASATSLLGGLLILVGVSAFALLALHILGLPSGVLAIADPALLLGVISLPLLALWRVLNLYGYTPPYYFWSHPAALQLALFGFPISTIYGVMVRTVHFRIARLYRPGLVAAWILHGVGLLAANFALVLGDLERLPLVAAGLIMGGGFSFLYSIDAFRRSANMPHVAKMSERDRERYRYFEPLIVTAGVWLVVGLLLGVAHTLNLYLQWGGGYFIRDAFIHANTVGFIGTTIMAYGAILLPPLMSGRTPYRGLSLLPAWLVSLGNAWRVGGDLLMEGVGLAHWSIGLSGIPVVVGLIYYMGMVHRLRA